MKTILHHLKKAVTSYPIPDGVIEDVMATRNVNPIDEFTAQVASTSSYRLVVADLQRWVSTAPNITQGNTAINLLYSDRERLREMANATYKALKDSNYIPDKKVKFGYKGSKL